MHEACKVLKVSDAWFLELETRHDESWPVVIIVSPRSCLDMDLLLGIQLLDIVEIWVAVLPDQPILDQLHHKIRWVWVFHLTVLRHTQHLLVPPASELSSNLRHIAEVWDKVISQLIFNLLLVVRLNVWVLHTA